MTNGPIVAAWQQKQLSYCEHPPYHAPQAYAELRFQDDYDETNQVYSSVRQLFALLGYDTANFGSGDWNPLGWLIRPGNTVLLKPNFIAEHHAHSDEWLHVITHGSVLRAVIDYVYIALKGRGRIQVADAPQTDSQISTILERVGFEAIRELYRRKLGFEIEFIDLRDEYWESKDGVITKRVRLPGDPLGTVRVNLGNNSYFSEIDHMGRRYYGAFYDVDETNRHHRPGVHEYVVACSPLAADVFISLPKMKTHKKVGVTCNLKGLVGIAGDKNYLPHYAIGSPEANGDQFPASRQATRLENLLVIRGKKLLSGGNSVSTYLGRKLKPVMYRVFGSSEQTVRAGNWWGNDTCWRMSLDLNRVLLYAGSDGIFRDGAKPYFSVVDGIVAMEGNGPVGGTAKSAGLLIAGSNPGTVDAAVATLMGFDCEKLALIRRSFDEHSYGIANGRPDDILCVSNQPAYNRVLREIAPKDTLQFRPHFGWTGNVELTELARATV